MAVDYSQIMTYLQKVLEKMYIRQFTKRKSISDSRSVENISDKRLRIKAESAQKNGVKRVKRQLFVNTRLHCIANNLKMISQFSTLPLLEKFLQTPMPVQSNRKRECFRHWCRSWCFSTRSSVFSFHLVFQRLLRLSSVFS